MGLMWSPKPARVLFLLGFLLVAWGAASLTAQESGDGEAISLTGTISDREDGLLIVGSVIKVVNGPKIRAEDGTFSVFLAPGAWVLEARAVGYLPTTIPIELEPGSSRELQIELSRSVITDEVRVIAERPIDPAAPATVIQPETVFNVAGSLDNVFRTLQALPGVAAPDDFGSRLSVRGGGPDQNLTMFDGVEIYNPYRLFGLTSAFNPETVADFQLTAGGFSSRYGDRLSSLLVVDSRPGRTAIGGAVAASITDANVVVEGALPGNEQNSWLFTARRTYYDLIVGPLVDAGDLPSFNDLQFRVDAAAGPGMLTFTGIRSREGTDLDIDDEDEDLEATAFSTVSNDLLAARYDVPIGQKATSSTVLSWYDNSDFLEFDGSFRNDARRSNIPGEIGSDTSEVIFARDLIVKDIVLRQDFAYSLNQSNFLGFGAEIHDLESTTAFITLGDRNDEEANGSSVRGGVGLPDAIDSALKGVRGGLWFEDQISITRDFTLTPGVRFDWSSINEGSTVSPRLSALYSINQNTRIRAAGGLYTQSPGYEKLVSADYFVDLTDAAEVGIRHQRGVHAILGVERDFPRNFSLRLEGYYKTYDDLIIGRLETEEERLLRVARYDFPEEIQSSVPTAPIITSNPSNDGKGDAYGMDFFAVRRPSPNGKFGGWFSYTLAWANQDAYDRNYAFDYDRRHSVNLVGYYRLGRRWELAATGRWASGFPRTPPIGLRVVATEDPDHDPDSPLSPALIPATDPFGNYIYQADYGDVTNLNSGRLPYYARLDTRISFRPGGLQSKWMIYVEVLNLLGRENAGNLEPTLEFNPDGDEPTLVETPDEALPRLPTIGVRYRF